MKKIKPGLKKVMAAVLVASICMAIFLLAGCNSAKKYENYLLKDFPTDNAAGIMETNDAALKILEAEKLEMPDRYKTYVETTVKSQEFASRQIVESRTILHKDESTARYLEFLQGSETATEEAKNEITIRYTCGNGCLIDDNSVELGDFSRLNVDEITNDVQCVFGALEDEKAFKEELTNRIKKVEATTEDGIEEKKFMTASGVEVNVYSSVMMEFNAKSVMVMAEKVYTLK